MQAPDSTQPSQILAIVYSDGARAALLLQRTARALQAAGHVCAGFVQHDEPRPGRSRCDMILENLLSGERVRISQDRGEGARGCHLDPHVLLGAMTAARAALPAGVDVLVLNKFGKSEAEGSGFRPLIADAVERGIAVVTGVSQRNLGAFRAFAGELAREIDIEAFAGAADAELLATLALPPPTPRKRSA